MKLRQAQAILKISAMLLALATGPLWAGTEGTSSTFYGQDAGASASSSSGFNTFVGRSAGFVNTGATGYHNTFVGYVAGYSNTTGSYNTFLGDGTGYSNTTGPHNTFLGYSAGYFNTTGSHNTFLGTNAGSSNTIGSLNTFIGSTAGGNNSTGESNAFLGTNAGSSNTIGSYNAFLGYGAGTSNTTGNDNTILGSYAGNSNTTGHDNVFLGYGAGSSETDSNKLYIDNCLGGFPCTSPFVYGEFDNHLLRINGVTHVAANNVAKSQMHFSLNNADSGGFLTSVSENNFFVSSGARYNGGWLQLSADGNAVIAGSGGVGYRIFTHIGAAQKSTFTPTLRLHIDYSGQFGINTAPVAGHEIHTSSGAYLAGGTWTDASSRDYKERIAPLSGDAATQTLAALNPVTFVYKSDAEQGHVGFIAEDVPDLVATRDRKGLSPMDIVAVLTKVVQEKSRALEEQSRLVQKQRTDLAQMHEQLSQLAAEVRRLQRHDMSAGSQAP